MDWSGFAPRNDSSKRTPHTERILPFPGVARRELRTIEVSPLGREGDEPVDVLCDLSAYRRPALAGRDLDRELDRMQTKLDTLRDDVEHFRFPGLDDRGPRHAA